MSMTLEEAIKLLKQYQGYDPMFPDGETLKHAFDLTDETVDTLLSALRPVSREQVEKARWIKIYEDGEPAIEQHQIGVACSKCMNMPKDRFTESKFCPNCGRPMTGEAVEMVMRRLEVLHDKDV